MACLNKLDQTLFQKYSIWITQNAHLEISDDTSYNYYGNVFLTYFFRLFLQLFLKLSMSWLMQLHPLKLLFFLRLFSIIESLRLAFPKSFINLQKVVFLTEQQYLSFLGFCLVLIIDNKLFNSFTVRFICYFFSLHNFIMSFDPNFYFSQTKIIVIQKTFLKLFFFNLRIPFQSINYDF